MAYKGIAKEILSYKSPLKHFSLENLPLGKKQLSFKGDEL